MAESTSSIYKSLSELLRLEKYFIRKVILLSSLAGLFSLAIPVGVQLLLTFVTAQEVRPGMYAILLLILFFVWLNGILQIRLMKEGEDVEQRLFVQLAYTYLKRILNQNTQSNDRSFAKYFIEISYLQKGFSKLFIDLLFASLQLTFGLMLISFYHPMFFLFGLSFVISFIFLLRWKFNAAVESSYEESCAKYEMVNWLSLAELFRKKFNRPNPDFAFTEANKISEDYLQNKRFHFKLLLQKQNAFLAFKLVAVGGMLLLGSVLAVDQKISIGQFLGAEIVIVLVISSIEKILFSLSTVFDTLTSMQKALSFQNNLQTDFSENEEHRVTIPSIDFIEMSSPSYFRMEPCNSYELTGNPSSCKKFLQSLDLRNENTFGLKCNGHDLKHVSIFDFKTKTAWCDHLPVILEDSFFANVKWNTNASNEEIIAAAELVGLNQFYENTNEGIYKNTHHRDSFWTLENRALLELARAIVSKPDLLVLRNQYILQHPRGLGIIQSEFKSSIVLIHNITELPLTGVKKIQIN
jgi:ABC-type bacteriocin/lantibiotic exporter with double-glycine peptidase domain